MQEISMNKVYVLKYHYNQYDQLDGYVLGIFKEDSSRYVFNNRVLRRGDFVFNVGCAQNHLT